MRSVHRTSAVTGAKQSLSSHALGGVCRHRELDADDELPLEDRQRLCLPLQLEVGGFREHHLRGLHGGQWRKGERRGDERRISRGVRLEVEALGHAHPEQRAHLAAGANVALDPGRELGLHAAELRDHRGRRQQQQRERRDGAGP
jgi:hypothetical protein